MKYKVIGNHPVAGVAPGKTVELDLPEANIKALVSAGHIASVKPPSVKPADPSRPDLAGEDARSSPADTKER